ncbi:hypothetical protein E8E14_009427 [Neopestalotiopsis sp. 37M]|nr:hypothetical protein E8E14_009427 [Neopestalotiopsis sp. 37M]
MTNHYGTHCSEPKSAKWGRLHQRRDKPQQAENVRLADANDLEFKARASDRRVTKWLIGCEAIWIARGGSALFRNMTNRRQSLAMDELYGCIGMANFAFSVGQKWRLSDGLHDGASLMQKTFDSGWLGALEYGADLT